MSDVEIANQERDQLIINLEEEKQLSYIKYEFEKLQAEYLEHQKISAEQILGRDRYIEGRNLIFSFRRLTLLRLGYSGFEETGGGC